MKHLKYILIVSLTTLISYATTYETGNKNNWKVYDNTPKGAYIDTIYNQSKDSNVIKFIGSNTRNGYILGNWEGGVGAWNNTTEFIINWSMHFHQAFVIYVRVMTKKGARYIYYTPSNKSYGKNNEYIHIGLGYASRNGVWQNFSRDLEADLKKYEPSNALIAVNALLVRGSGMIDDISLQKPIGRLYGLTLDTVSDIDNTVDALKSFSKRITTRVVFDRVPASNYINALNKLEPYTNIMGQLFDSEYIKYYTLDEYKSRVNAYLDTHGSKVKIWEIGNEVNGEWTGNPTVVAQKTIAAYNEVKKRGYKTALTLYYNDFSENDGCYEHAYEKMRDWARERLNDTIKNGIDYVFVSYYEEDCDYHIPTLSEWENVFDDLGQIFPHAKLGFGEVGTTTQNKEDYLNRYYGLDIKHPRYVGGHFWWYFKEDMVPKNKPLWNTMNAFLSR